MPNTVYTGVSVAVGWYSCQSAGHCASTMNLFTTIVLLSGRAQLCPPFSVKGVKTVAMRTS